MQSVSVRTMKQYCSVCKAEYDMEIIKRGSSESVVWLKCPECQGFLPYMPDEETDAKQTESTEEELALEDLDIESAKEYSENDRYEIGEILHHRSWNDFGKVLSKDTLPGNRRTIWVQFLRQGKVQLLEGVVS